LAYSILCWAVVVALWDFDWQKAPAPPGVVDQPAGVGAVGACVGLAVTIAVLWEPWQSLVFGLSIGSALTALLARWKRERSKSEPSKLAELRQAGFDGDLEAREPSA
jgi:hypothetical protein